MNISFLNSFQIQILAVELVLCWGAERRKLFWLRLLPCAALYLFLPRVVPGSYFSPFLTVGWFTFGFLIMLALSGGVLALCFRLSWREVVFFCCVAHTVQHAVHCLAAIFSQTARPEGPAGELFQLAVMLAALGLCYAMRRTRRITGPDMERGQLLLFACFSSALVYCLSLWTTMQETGTVGMYLFDFFCCAELLMILLDTFQLRKARRDQVIMEHIFRQERAQHELAKANIEVINRKCHDLKHQVAALRRMDDQTAREQALGELEQSVLLYDRFAHTGCEDLDVVLTEKGLICEQQDIQLQCIADGGGLEFMDAADLYALFGNALDNAIEAAAQVENPNSRIITLNVARRGRYTVVHMENPCPADLEFQDGLPSTTKGDSDYHGFGMRSMRYVAEKYGGTITAAQEDGFFLLDILLLPASA